MFSIIKNKKGQSLIEYMLLVCIMGVGTMGVLRFVGKHTSVKFAEVANVLAGEKEAKISGGANRVSADHYQRKDLSDFMNGATSKD